MQVGETVSDVQAMADRGECAICSKTHSQPKKEDVKDVAPQDGNWHRKAMSKVFEKTSEKQAIYPNSSFPPNYKHQGHHCIALKTLVQDADKSPKDRILRLNHFLKKVGFYPNRDKNCIGLPEMAAKKRQEYGEFWKSIDEGKPLQLHGPGHDVRYFAACTAMVQRLLQFIVPKAEDCEEKSKDDWENDLKELIGQAENHAFICLARASWVVHRKELSEAINIYQQKNPRKDVRFPILTLQSQGGEGPFKKSK
ncbi:hypothetical protein [Sorangium sp. So ce117]|uniref:hypothetical protein n=1 Tax=Sorangium sp. So ce117 TaxID=3133277 RepID=UPI003F62C133